jgi:predicted DsbA family dithiol-disulfide isomerase
MRASACQARRRPQTIGMSKRLPVEIWSDIACPWCYVGKRRFEAALTGFAHAAQVDVTWRAFELDPSAPRTRPQQGYADRIAGKYGRSRAEAQGMVDRMVETARADGLALDFEHIQPGNTFDAHRLLHLALERGQQDALKERLFRGYLSEGRSIGEPATLLSLATDAGLATDEASAVLNSDQYASEVRADEAEASALGIHGVPFFVIGRRYAVEGAQPAELIRSALETAWSELPESIGGAVSEGAVCGPDGCVVENRDAHEADGQRA